MTLSVYQASVPVFIRGLTVLASLLEKGLAHAEAAGTDPADLVNARLAPDMYPLSGQIQRASDAAKFAVQLDAGENLAMLEHPHDLWLSALRLGQQTWLAFGLAGCPADGQVLGAVPADQGLALVRAVLERFLDLATPAQSRMRQLLEVCSATDFIDGLGLAIRRDAAVLAWRREPRSVSWLGVLPQAQSVALGVAPPQGRLTPAMLRGAARVAREHGDGSLRLSPWQSLVLTNLQAQHIDHAQAGLSA
ncbi:MAG: DUF1993 family protein, partial [Starkeya sp.]|nr:DUF1993 family protein [Starkeya sp.]